MFGTFAVGQHVIAKADLDGWLGPLGYPAVKRGTRGIVRATPGWFSDRYTVEFYARGNVSVSGRQLKPATFGGGEASWRRYRQTRQGVALGLFVLFGLPAVIAIGRHYATGGSTADLVAALPMAAAETIVDLVGLLGLPLTLMVGAALWARNRLRRR